jgi:hypothetical protein
MQKRNSIAEIEDTGSTARIDRRLSVLAQIEAALLADKLGMLEVVEESGGSDPYNRGRVKGDTWSAALRR